VPRAWQPTSAALDTEPPREPDLSYVVCSTPRCGSGLLTRGLASTGVAGTPAEYFHTRNITALCERWGLPEAMPVYAPALRTRRTDANGVFGVKIHWDQLEALNRRAGDPEAIFTCVPGARFVHISRRDTDAQAVSLWVALLTDSWHREAGEPAPRRRIPYDYGEIERLRALVLRHEAAWAAFFAARGLRPLEVVYEDLVAGYEDELRRVVGALRPGVAVGELPPPISVRQGGERTRLLVERFRRDRERRGGAPARATARTRLRLARHRVAARLR
jgi:LPS sulfotransferase NodH